MDPGSVAAAVPEDSTLLRPGPILLGGPIQGAGAGGSDGATHAAAASAVEPGSAAAGRSSQVAPAASGAAVSHADAGHVCAARAQGATLAVPACSGGDPQAVAAAGDLKPEQRCEAGRAACARVSEALWPPGAEGAGMLAAGSAELPVSTVPLG